MIVEGANRPGLFVLVLRIDHRSGPEHIVDQNHATRPRPRQEFFVVSSVVRLIRVDERQIEVALLGQSPKCLERGGDSKVDLV